MATIRDVARIAEVSIATVSRVFNGSPRVSDGTIRRVREAAARVDYWPNEAARSLTRSRTSTLGVLLPDLYGEFFSEVIRGIDHATQRERLRILVSSSHAYIDELVSVARAVRGSVDGLIIMAPDEGSASAIEEITRNFPVVLLNPRFDMSGCASISIASYDGAYEITEHLIHAGHTAIAMIKGPAGNVDAEQRLRGYRAALARAGIPPRESWEIQGDFSESSGYESAAHLLGMKPRPTAVFAANDYMAIGLLSALHGAGMAVPNGMAVAGFDDIVIAQYLSPPLTTVHVDAYELGGQAVRHWLLSMQPPEAGGIAHTVLPVKLVVRESCGSPRCAGGETKVRRRDRTRTERKLTETAAKGSSIGEVLP